MQSLNFLRKTMKGKSPFVVLLAIAIFAVSFYAGNFIFSDQAAAASIIWNGEGGDNNWSTGANWVGGTAPGASDIAVFDGTTGSSPDKDCTIDSGFGGRVGGIQIAAEYSGTITQGTDVNLFIDDDGISIAGGTFTGSNALISIDGDFSLTGGTYSAAPETRVYGDWTFSSGTFNHNNGIVTFGETGTDNTHEISGNNTFYNVRTRPGSEINSIADIQLAAGSTTTILNNLTIDLGYLNVLQATSRARLRSNSAGSTANLSVGGRANLFHVDIQDIVNTGASFDCRVKCADSGNNTNISFANMIGFYISEISNETTEAGGTAIFSVVLTGKPSANVSIPVTSSDSGEGTPSTATLTFTTANWETPQTVTVTGQDDGDIDGTITYAIQLGAITSSDTRYNGVDPADVTVRNQDDEVSTTAFNFDYLGNYDVEDVSETTGTDVGVFGGVDADVNGLGLIFENDVTFPPVNVLNTKIQPGCKMGYRGNEYNITQSVDINVYGYDMALGQEYGNSEDIGLFFGAAGDYSVSEITCLESENGQVKLNDAFVNTEQVTLTGSPSEMLYVSSSNTIFAPDPASDTVDLLNPATGAISTVTVGNGPYGMAYDSVRDHLWVVNSDDDTITALEASDGSYAFTDLGSSTFSTASDYAMNIAYDSTNDKLWVSHAFGNELWQFDPADGSHDATVTVTGTSVVADVEYDVTNDSIWALYEGKIVEIDGSTGTFKTGSETTSTYDVPLQGTEPTSITYDVTSDSLWIVDRDGEGNDDEVGYVQKIRASDGIVIGSFITGENPSLGTPDAAVTINSADNEIWIANDGDISFTVLEASTGRMKGMYVGSPGVHVFDGNGDMWNELGEKYIYNGVPADYYYTVSSNTTSDLDVSAVSSIDTTTVTETLNGQSIYYSVSFDDGDSYKVEGSWRTIASNKNADHGGVEGNWYYRDNADTWTAATPNDKNAAISQAIEAGANNQMSGTELAALTSGDWAQTGGFEAGTTSNLNMAATFFTDDPHDSPSLDNVTFTFGAGGSSSSSSSNTIAVEPIDPGVNINGDDVCTAAQRVMVTLTSKNADSFMIGNDQEMTGADWQEFVDGGELLMTTEQGEVNGGPSMVVEWELEPGDGQKTVYAMFRSSTGNTSDIVSDAIILDVAGQCEDVEELPDEEPEDTDDDTVDEPVEKVMGCMGIVQNAVTAAERAQYRFGVSPMSGEYSTYDQVRAGDVIRAKSFDTVYCIADDMTRRPFVDELTYFTHMRSFEDVRWVTDDTLSYYDLKDPVLPNLGVNLLKFTDSAKVYYFGLNTDKTGGTLHWITNEELATALVGDDWDDYVIDLNPLLRSKFEEGDPITEEDQIDTELLRRRQFLNEKSSDKDNQELKMMLLKQGKIFRMNLMKILSR